MIPSRILLIANPASPRVDGFQRAVLEHGLPAVELLAWRDFLRERELCASRLEAGTLLRIESAGEDTEVQRLLLERGEGLSDDTYSTPRLSSALLDAGRDHPCRILAPRQQYLGLRSALRELGSLLAAAGGVAVMNPPETIATMLDKERTAAVLRENGIPAPEMLGTPGTFDELIMMMRLASCSRVFVKLANGSSGSGVVAYATDGRRHLALTTVEVVADAAGVALYNSKKLLRYSGLEDIRILLDALCREGVVAQRWIPKATIGNRVFDMRVLVVDGRARHTVVRTSPGPITNLHIGRDNRRGCLDAVRERVGENSWLEGLDQCRRAVASMPGALYGGVDLMFPEHPGSPRVLEVNAFGDWLKRDLHENENPWEAELSALLPRAESLQGAGAP